MASNKITSRLPKIDQEIQNIDIDDKKPWMPFESTCLPLILVVTAMQQIRNHISTLEDKKWALLQEHKDLIVHDLTPQPKVLVQVVKDTFLDGGSDWHEWCEIDLSFIVPLVQAISMKAKAYGSGYPGGM
ncbi:hypothetical protein E5676_scaffold124G001270 [Cucumis melo var. makuwa]|uniref:Uncharacterized protein n=1 Tax=Cucumis melo var. makuwa TaxID=1194695 RepID=A0A5D3DTI4_CUCMM|nr:hypothetical protein E5676_scaffold124G001270 [Cucumis melo var. makuwa]